MSGGGDSHELLNAIRRIHERVRDAVVAESERVTVRFQAQPGNIAGGL